MKNLNKSINIKNTWAYTLLFAASGGAGLIYELSWIRQAGILLGNTIQSASVVVASFFGGIALGNLLVTRLKKIHPITLYAGAELLAALWAFLVPSLLAWAAKPPFVGLLSLEFPALQVLVRILFVTFCLLPATCALGMTFPALAIGVAGSGDARKVANVVYIANLIGGLVGILAVLLGLFLQIGVIGSSYVAGGLSAFCALGAISLRAFYEEHSRSEPVLEEPSKKYLRKELYVAGLSGLCTMALQVLYCHMFSLVFHNSVYTFGIVLVVFLLGLALGGWCVNRFGNNFQEKTIASLMQICGILVCTSVLVFILFTRLEYFSVGKDFFGYAAGALSLVFGILILPIACAGMLLPLTWKGLNAKSLNIQSLAQLSLWNTVGCLIGPLVANFFLMPILGLWGGFAAIAIFYVLGASLIFANHLPRQVHIFGIAAACFAFLSTWQASKYQSLEEDEKILQAWEGGYGRVDVVQDTQTKKLQLRQNIHYGLGSTSSAPMQKRQAHVPILLHPHPKKVLFIGLATGVTAGAALEHSMIEQINVVELIPNVVKAAAYFSESNHDILQSSKSRVHVNDGRYFLLSRPDLYDVIVGDLFVPWESQTGYLYSIDHFKVVRSRLAEGGIFCQWLPMWQLTESDFRMIADSFAAVFPHTSLWFGKIDPHWTIVGILGTEKPLNVTWDSLAARLTLNSATDPAWFSSTEDLFRFQLGKWPIPSATKLNSDEFPIVEFMAPISTWKSYQRLRFDRLRDFYTQVLAPLPLDTLPANAYSATFKEQLRGRQWQNLQDQR